MNQTSHKNTHHCMNIPTVLGMICLAAIICSTGIFTCLLKNEQVKVLRDNEQLNVEINSCEKDIALYDFKCEEQLNHSTVKERLALHKSTLINLQADQIREINRHGQPAVASGR